ncbi:hypothetical protein [Anoxynatronum sibiricum]|uniref:Uncharacterized protein n=1 Tax=Anoxynatronum sibiricum TaxID=210623 RepID=A0ABU9VSV2_9CLOT
MGYLIAIAGGILLAMIIPGGFLGLLIIAVIYFLFGGKDTFGV